MASDRLMRDGPAPGTGIVHFGPGAFFRAFNAAFTHEAMEMAGGDWGIEAVSLKSPTARDQLLPQGGVYTAVELGPEGETHKIITSIANVLVASEDPSAVVKVLTNPKVKIVSLTITEKGYGYDPTTKGLDLTHPDIAADLADPSGRRSAVCLIAAALEARRLSGTPPFTVMSCDNLPSNGHVTKTVVRDFAKHVFPDLVDWIAQHGAFPSTMVDRITPATTNEDLAELEKAIGYHDPAAVFHEPFRQWVIEDSFVSGRPAWDRAGAQFVQSVDAHETMKLRCLNGTHSALAYLGYLAGHQTIAGTIAAPGFTAFCEYLWQSEILPTVPQPEGEDLQAYTDALLARYRNPNIQHRTWQIAMDGSQKLPQRLLGTVRDHLKDGHLPTGLCLVVAAWMRYVGGVDETGAPIDVRDPMADRLKQASDAASGAVGKVEALLSVTEVFGRDLAASEAFRDAVTAAYQRLEDQGAATAVSDFPLK